MEEWKEYKLGDVCAKIGSGATPKGGKEAYLGGNTSLIRSQNVLDFAFSWDGLAYIDDEQAAKLNGVEIEKGDVLLNITGDSVARVCIVPESALPARVNQHVSIVRGDTEVVLNDYIMYFLQYKKPYLLSLSQGGATRNALTKGMIEDLSIPLPPLSKQAEIVHVLKSLDDKIEVNRQINDNFVIEGFFEVLLVWMLTTPINDNLEQQAQALFKSWFVDFEPFRNQPFVESELGMIPQGWQVGTLAEITQQKSEKVGQQEDVKVLSPVTTGKLMLSEEYFTKQVFSESIAKYKVVEIGDFAYNPARVNIGSIGRNEYGFRGCVSPVYIVFSCKDGYDYFFDLFRKTEKFQTEVKARAIGGVRQSLNYTDFGFIQTVIAPTDVMKKFNPFYEKIQAAQKHLEEENSRLSSLRDTLLPRLMSGELSVKEIVNM